MRPAILSLFCLSTGCCLFIACAAPLAGTSVEVLPEEGAVRTRATTAELDGLRVLFNGATRGSEDGAWMATSSDELDQLWSDLGGVGPAPAVDFGTHVVLGAGFEGSPCQQEIVSAELDQHSTLRMTTEQLRRHCISLAVRVGRIVAVPRRILPSRFVWAARNSPPWIRRFELPAAQGSVVPPDQPSLDRDTITESLGDVILPDRNTIAARALIDGRQIWVAHHADGRVGVVAADRLSEQPSPLRQLVRWQPRTGRFDTGHDSLGRAVNGGVPLETFTFRRLGENRIAVGASRPIPNGPVVPREQAPELVGPDVPYQNEGPLAAPAMDVSNLPNGRVVRVDAQLVFGVDGPPQLCSVPEQPKLRRHFLRCGSGSLTVANVAPEERHYVTIVDGPFVVRRNGPTLDLVVGTGGGVSTGVREHRIQEPGVPGTTRERGTLQIGSSVEGDTEAANDGFRPPCVDAPGGPDESWLLTSSSPAQVTIELESEFDGALAVVDENNRVLACNDDYRGHYRSSVVSVELSPGTQMRVIVDGFGGAAGSYRLRTRLQAAGR